MSHSTPKPHALLSGGGSGGHVFPGLAVAEELRRRGWAVSWAGSAKGLEARLVGERDVPFHALPARPLVGQGLLGKVRAGTTLLGSALRARSLVRRLGASVVVGTGGYVSAPAVLGGRLAQRPILLVEPNAAVGVANRFLSRFVDGAAVTYDSTAGQLRCPSTVTGVPIRDAFFHVDAAPNGPPWHLLVLGGSQGAQQLNELLPAALASLPSDLGQVSVVHQAGARHVDAARQAYEAQGLPEHVSVEVTPFLDDMPASMDVSHLVISRAGAITLAELCAAGRPSLLAPLSIAGGHQIDNARRLEEAGASLRLPADAASVGRLLADLLADPERLRTLSEAARDLARPGAAGAIADHIETLTQEGLTHV